MIITTNTLPKTCEFCGSELNWEGPNLICSNLDCPNIEKEQLKAWLINLAPVDGLGWKTIEKLCAEKHIYSVKDIYKNSYYDYIFDNVKENSEKGLFNKMLNKIYFGNFTYEQFLLALNIPGIGKVSAKNIMQKSDAYNYLYSITVNNTSSISEWAKLLQDSNTALALFTTYRTYFTERFNTIKHQIIDTNYVNTTTTELKGQVVITGTLSIKRDDFIKQIENAGWAVSSKINKNTKYLITNTPDSGTSKNKEADKFGVPKITESEFISICLK